MTTHSFDDWSAAQDYYFDNGLTDGLPIFGYRRKPYLIIAGLLGTTAWASLATVVQTPLQAVVASTVAARWSLAPRGA